MGLLDNLNFSQPFRISSLLPSEAQLQAFKDKSDAEAIAQFSQDTNPIRRGAFNLLTALGVNPTLAQAAPTTLDVAPVTGDISALADARTAFGQGDLATAGLLTAATLIPGVPAGKVKGLLKKSDDTKPLLNVDDAPTEGIANVVPPTDNEPGIIAFHGSGADFDKFRVDKIGTGEGNQTFGYGLYFTDSEDIAKFYRETLRQERNMLHLDGKMLDSVYTADNEEKFGDYVAKNFPSSIHDDVYMVLDNLGQGLNSIQDADNLASGTFRTATEKQIYNKIRKDLSLPELPEGKTYKVALAPKPDELLDYDLPLSEQSDFIKNNPLIKKLIKEDEDYRKRYPFSPIGERRGGNVLTTVSEADLNASGIKGIKYLAGDSRNTFGGKLLGINKLDDGQFRARIVLDDPNRQTGLGGSGRVITTSKPYKTQKEAEDWANKQIGNKTSNYVIFDENLINILAKYGIVGGVGITALQNSDI